MQIEQEQQDFKSVRATSPDQIELEFLQNENLKRQSINDMELNN